MQTRQEMYLKYLSKDFKEKQFGISDKLTKVTSKPESPSTVAYVFTQEKTSEDGEVFSRNFERTLSRVSSRNSVPTPRSLSKSEERIGRK